MSIDNRKRVAKIVKEEDWTIIWVGADMPCQLLDEQVLLMYEDMDGEPCICEAIYTYDRHYYQHEPYFKRISDGAHMMQCIAWKRKEVAGGI